jgi:hypothetical protein
MFCFLLLMDSVLCAETCAQICIADNVCPVCNSGYMGVDCRTPCSAGFYGLDCADSCMSQFLPLTITMQSPATGSAFLEDALVSTSAQLVSMDSLELLADTSAHTVLATAQLLEPTAASTVCGGLAFIVPSLCYR